MATKKSKKLGNPFVYEGYEGPEYFCDRTEETEKLSEYLKNGVNMTLVSPRKSRNHLPGASSTKAALAFLLDHELVYREPEGKYTFTTAL